MLRRFPARLSSLRRRVVQTLTTPDAHESPPPPPGEDLSPAPSTVHSLPLAGGVGSSAERDALHAHILSSWQALPLPPHASVHPLDIIPCPSASAAFVGVGLQTNWPSMHAAMDNGIFGPAVRKVIAVRDVFDRQPERALLSDWFALLADDVAAVVKDVVQSTPTSRRFVNEYVRGADPDSPYVLVKNDVDLIEYLHGAGMRVLPVADRAELERFRSGQRPIPAQQSTNHVLACAPTAFQFNRSAAADNHFMSEGNLATEPAAQLRRRVLTEFANLHQALTDRSGVGALVHLFTHEDWHNTPDACFPNNTFSTHTNYETGNSCVLVLYPMKDETRRKERRLVQRLLQFGRYTQVYDLTREEERGRPAFLEGTGSLVLDRVNRIAYVALSQRSDVGLARMWAQVMGYTVVPFVATDREERPIYHTNVMMSVGTRVAVVCSESIRDENERRDVLGMLKMTGHAVVEISYDQVERFCGNILELESFHGEQVMVMSTGAYEAFEEWQKEELLGGVARLVHADISTIERVGGGGVRCTIAELH